MTENQKLREALQAISDIDDSTNYAADASAALDHVGQIARQALALPTADHIPDAGEMVADHLPDAGKMIETAAPGGGYVRPVVLDARQALPTAAQVDDIDVAESFTSVTKTAAPVGERAKFDAWKKTMQNGFDEWDAWQAALSAGYAGWQPIEVVPEDAVSMPQYWSVDVHCDGDTLVSIGHDWLSGSRPLDEQDELTSLGAAKHLLSFIGYGLPQNSFDPDTTSPALAPLTDDQMWSLWNSQGIDEMNQSEAIAFGRDVERAHGIDAAMRKDKP